MQTHLHTATTADVLVDDTSLASPRCLCSVVQATIAVAGFVFGMHHVLDDKTDKLYKSKYGQKYRNLWHFCKQNICPDPIWKPVTTI